MPNKFYKDQIIKRIKSFVEDSNLIESLEHNGMKGEIRESGLGKLFSEFLPSNWDIGSGKIIDSEGNQSPQIDLLIYNKNIIPPIMLSAQQGVYPYESVGFAFEIKTTSNALEIKKTINNFKQLRSLKKIEGSRYRPVRIYFAIKSDLKEKTEFERYKELDENYNTSPAIESICVINKGYWTYKPVQKPNGEIFSNWMETESDNFSEVIFLLAGVINSISFWIGKYIIEYDQKLKKIAEK